METLKSYGRNLGLSDEVIGKALRYDRSATETFWVEGAEGLAAAGEIFERGRLLEYHCRDNDGRPQGKAAVELISWVSQEEGFFCGAHVKASDGYYQWYAEHSLREPDECAYHLCGGDPTRCRARPKRGDRREIVHIGLWRLLNPHAMVQTPVRLGKQALEDAAAAVAPGGAGPPGGSPPAGAGLDAVLAEAPPEPVLPPGEKREKKPRKSRSRSRHRTSRGVAGYLRERAEAHQKRREEKEIQDRKKKEARKERKDKEARRKDKGIEESSSSSPETSDASSGFHAAPSRGGGDLKRVAQKKPGRLLAKSLKEMARFLAEREEDEGGEEAWKGRRVMAYVSQVMLVTHPPAKIGIRNHREVISLAVALDQLLQGKLAECGDLLVQRLKALETSFADGSWNSARHQELIPEVGASMTSQREREETAKAELRVLKLKQALQKAK